jgi:microsomal epoxide hydrolase
MEYRPFSIEVPQRDLDDLRARLGRTRWPNELQPQGWDRGTELEFLQELTRYWLEEYDWRVVEKSLNRFPHFITQAQGLELHFVHEKSGSADAVPIVLLHGWSDSFYRFSHLIELLTRTAEGEGGVVFDVVVPSLPGFDFSAQPGTGQAGATFAAASVAELMAGLGYEQYFVHGGDWGSAVAQEIARNHPDRVMGLHLTDVPFGNIFLVDKAAASAAEAAYLAAVEAWSTKDAAYVAVQSTKPLTLSYGLSDSPVGLAAWLIEHFERLSEQLPAKDDLITNVMLYWFGNTIRSSIRYYSEGMDDDWSEGGDDSAWDGAAEGGASWDAGSDETGAGWGQQLAVPTGFALFPKDIATPPREFAERFFTVTRFTTMERGGHFAALEVPGLLAADLRAFATELT